MPIPESILSELKAQITVVGELHEQDLAAGYDGVFLDDAVEKKAGRIRCPSHSKASGARQTEDDDDLLALRAGQDGQGAEKPA